MSTPFRPDTPATQDFFGRGDFAKTLAQSICLPAGAQGIVVGVEGEWGSGKSSLINQIKGALANVQGNILVEFKPWTISGSEAIIESLLTSIAAQIGYSATAVNAAKGLSAGEKLLSYVGVLQHLKYLKYVPAASWLGNIAEDVGTAFDSASSASKEARIEGKETLNQLRSLLPKFDLEAKKKGVESALGELDMSIVVVIDDLDRLQPAEIRSLFQAIKAVADFPRTSYLLAYDAKVVCKALANDGDESAGRAYLEKLVQVAYPIPPIFPWQLQLYLDQRLQSLVADLGLNLRPFERELWPSAISIARRLCKHPRDVVRLSNRLTISLPATIGAINICDVVVFEALCQTAPELREAMRANPQRFTGYMFSEDGVDEIDWTQHFGEAKKHNQSLWREYLTGDTSRINDLAAACEFLFPRLAENAKDENLLAKLRLANSRQLARLFALTAISGMPEVTHIHSLLAQPMQLKSALDSDPSDALRTLHWITEYLESAETLSGLAILKVLANFEAGATHSAEYFAETCAGLSKLLRKLLERLPPDERLDIAKVAVDAFALSTSHALVLDMATEHGLWDIARGERARKGYETIQNRAAVQSLVAQWCAKAGVSTANGSIISEPLLRSILFRWWQLGNAYFEVMDAVKTICSSHEGLRRLLQKYQDSDHPRDLGDFDLIWDPDELLAKMPDDKDFAFPITQFREVLSSPELRDRLAKVRAVEEMKRQAAI